MGEIIYGMRLHFKDGGEIVCWYNGKKQRDSDIDQLLQFPSPARFVILNANPALGLRPKDIMWFVSVEDVPYSQPPPDLSGLDTK